MKNLVVGSLSVLLLSVVSAPNVLAQQTTSSPGATGGTSGSTYTIEPFNLAWMAYQGYFKSQGIPQGRTLISAFASGDIKASDIVKSAISTNRLPAQFDPSNTYLGAMEIAMGKIAAR